MRIPRAVVLASLAVLVAALIAAPFASSRTHASTGITVTVTLREFKITLSKRTVPHGTVTFLAINKGTLAHDFHIAGKTTPLIQPGKKRTLVVTLTKGKYPYRCTVLGHALSGMKGVLTVT